MQQRRKEGSGGDSTTSGNSAASAAATTAANANSTMVALSYSRKRRRRNNNNNNNASYSTNNNAGTVLLNVLLVPLMVSVLLLAFSIYFHKHEIDEDLKETPHSGYRDYQIQQQRPSKKTKKKPPPSNAVQSEEKKPPPVTTAKSGTANTNSAVRTNGNQSNNDGGSNEYVASLDEDRTSIDYMTGQRQEYHIVFSTGCNTFQDWQSYVFFHSALSSGQRGTITRIVSGCEDAAHEKTVRDIFNDQIAPMVSNNGRFQIHFTPDYSTVPKKDPKPYKYFNKPFGMKHWMEHKLGYPDKPLNDDAIVILLDPDQVILRPFANNDFSQYESWFELEKGHEPRTRIVHGGPMGQLYGFGDQWKTKVNHKLFPPEVLNEGGTSPLDDLTKQQIRAEYPVGPPYIATAKDMYKISNTWSLFAPHVHDQYPHLLAEMFAYCLAAAHLKLPHQTAISFMVSSVTGDRSEGWKFIDQTDPKDICPRPEEFHRDADQSALPVGMQRGALPHVLHFCQKYALGKYFFGKYRLRKDFLSCPVPLLKEPPADLGLFKGTTTLPNGKVEALKDVHAKRNAFMLCRLIPAVNQASEYFKQRHCKPNDKDPSKVPDFSRSAWAY